MPLNDDVQEKAARFQSRQALHDLQLNQIKAAASPARQLNNFSRAASHSPKTPRGTHSAKTTEKEDDGLMVVGGSVVTPMKRMPILANFEEWMKMATDNKINAANSWNFALIDYFHDMSLLKEGDGVNFQKASCTLDGCVKIYTSRVDSVATETGKLLSGLADSGNKKRNANDEDGEDDEEEEEGEDGVKKRVKKRTQRSSEATLAPSFAPLQLKKFELEFSVDPLFKKASADFDEGGAKGLLLNHLAIDTEGKIVFDSSDDADAVTQGGANRRQSAEDTEESNENSNDVAEKSTVSAGTEDGQEDAQPDEHDVDISGLAAKFFPDLNILDTQDICPSLKTFDLGDPSGSLDIPFLKPPDDQEPDQDNIGGIGDKSGVFLDDDNAANFDDDDGVIGGFDIPADTGFGEGGEVWARDAAIETQNRVHDGVFEGEEGMEAGAYDAENGDYIVSLEQRRGKTEGTHDDILSYFDQAMQKNWAGPEHWRIRKIKDSAKLATQTTTKPRKEKEPFEIDFTSPLDPSLSDLIYTNAASNATISLPKNQWKSKTRNLLPDDKHFNSRHLLRLFLKPKARLGSRRKAFGGSRIGLPSSGDVPEGDMDEAFWARREALGAADAQGDELPHGDYDANFFQDDGLAFPGGVMDDDDDDFADARETFSPPLEGVEAGTAPLGGIDGVLAAGAQDGAFGNQLVTQSRRLRPEYVQYARVAKKVDVRRLKEEIWKGMGLGDADQETPPTESNPLPTPPPSKPEDSDAPLQFTSVINNLQSVYPKQAMADISTSYCFICLLHLANEKGLQIENQEGLRDLSIRRDFSAQITEGG
ncbi:MAG: hypothetical protein M4579_002345 [Chaenotheca gracillima]|nr:MAG: hypothetical protein M4579_002345 [Chaenotheca gracillima]